MRYRHYYVTPKPDGSVRFVSHGPIVALGRLLVPIWLSMLAIGFFWQLFVGNFADGRSVPVALRDLHAESREASQGCGQGRQQAVGVFLMAPRASRTSGGTTMSVSALLSGIGPTLPGSHRLRVGGSSSSAPTKQADTAAAGAAESGAAGGGCLFSLCHGFLAATVRSPVAHTILGHGEVVGRRLYAVLIGVLSDSELLDMAEHARLRIVHRRTISC